MNEGQNIRHLETLRSSQDLKQNLKGHGLTIKAVTEANGITAAKLKKHWEAKLNHNPVGKILIGGYIAVALGEVA
jgi:hypothetical protein